ncbi:protein CURLY FLAG LEAF 1-like [Nymphaea colorata]|nr:protein CURLY FLAG LEAF 1-like [Nymphaea colorata]
MEAYSLEQSLEPLSISDAGSSTGSSPENQSAPTSKLNLHDTSPPFLWDQYLDLKTGEIMYSVDWGRGRKAKRGGWNTRATGKRQGGRRSNDEGGEEEDQAEGSGTDSDAGSCRTPGGCCNKRYLVAAAGGGTAEKMVEEGEVLVVAGCKQCLMYFMLPKVADECPRCSSPLLHLTSL